MKMRKFVAMFTLLTLVLALTVPAMAGDNPPEEPELLIVNPEPEWVQGPGVIWVTQSGVAAYLESQGIEVTNTWAAKDAMGIELASGYVLSIPAKEDGMIRLDSLKDVIWSNWEVFFR
ncbi:MAG: hypothetical protein IJ217_01980 [Clostridia bacterium]|nr:hypothetical protein [Clostridia bacterium]